MQIAPGYMPPIARTRTGAETRSNNTQPLHWAQKLRREIFAGSIAAGTTASIFAPFESVKTRLQVQQAPEWPKIYEGGLMRSVMRIASEDGLALMWSHGFVPFVCRDFFYSGTGHIAHNKMEHIARPPSGAMRSISAGTSDCRFAAWSVSVDSSSNLR